MDRITELLMMGDSIMKTVTQAIESNNYSSLSDDIRKQVRSSSLPDIGPLSAEGKRQAAAKARAEAEAKARAEAAARAKASEIAAKSKAEEEARIRAAQQEQARIRAAQQAAQQQQQAYARQQQARAQQAQQQYANQTSQYQQRYQQTNSGNVRQPGQARKSSDYRQGYNQGGNAQAQYNQQYAQQQAQYAYTQRNNTMNRQAVQQNNLRNNAVQYNQNYNVVNKPLKTPFMQERPKYSGANGKVALGVLGLAVTLPLTVSLLIPAVTAGGAAAIGAAVVAALGVGGSAGLTASGLNQRKLTNKFYRYAQLLGQSEYFAIEDLSSMAGEDAEQVEKDLNKMIASNMLPQAKFDENKTTLILTDNAYGQYRQAMEAKHARETEQKRREAAIDSMVASGDIKEIMREGERVIRKIREFNDRIPDRVMSDKLDHLERVVDRIFNKVREDPDRAQELGKFMSYYLPTTEKLLDAYVELDRQPEVGENIPKTKKEIEEALDVINDAYEALLDSLFQDVAWDISSDITVMKTMMAQDGLRNDKIRTEPDGAPKAGDPAPSGDGKTETDPETENS